ncbi:MAG: DNA ligase D [Devosia nanyangense]|uniref:DNA ligase (ATP) n=1 Tax=Devosia nanyangense TaxID=1228055 RepID=A0A933L6N1_9HYPH|nr:DNA ligase D [Devosia nanyangense]
MAASPLHNYRQKRDFGKTPEPTGGGDGGGNRFVIHKHWATADHYDLRLELDGVLKSWAVPKGPSLNPADKRYAAETEDHPIEYLDFEGVIPEGEYGGGPMIVWDTGTWAPMGDIGEGLKKGDFKFRLWGEKLKGGWVLIRMKPKPGEAGKNNWLFVKERDTGVDTKTDILATRPESVKSGRRIEDLIPAKPAKAAKPVPLDPKKIAGAVKAPMPKSMKPQLASESGEPVKGEGWLHEIKFDGYRTIAMVTGGKVRLLTRTGIDWTARYGVLARAFEHLLVKEAVLDGEIVVVDDAGVSHFADLQQALSDHASERLTFFAFDLMHLDGYDLTKAKLTDRKALLQSLLGTVITANSAIQFSDGFAGDGQVLYDHATEIGLEGIVSKRVDAPYIEARSKTWVKTKALQAGDFPIVGYTLSPAAGGIGAIALGQWVDGELEYRGKCGTGFVASDLLSILAKLKPLAAPDQKLDGMPKDVIPVRPVITAHVHYANLTADKSVRHAVFKGLREPEITATEAPAPRKRLISDADLAGIWVTNPTRRLFGKSGPTKLDVAIYYAAVGDFMLPHIFGRPVSLVRSPSGRLDDIFFQRHPFTGMPPTIGSFETMSSDEGELKKYISIEDAKGYLALAQFGVIEFHAWGCHWKTALEKPDRVIFDLDPGEGIKFRQIVEAAVFVREFLEGLGLTPYVKTSGGKGLHVVVPLKPKLDWKKTHAATGEIATRIAKAAPETFVVNMAKDKRTRRIFIDFHRNYRGATAVAPYSLRARANLPASTPVNWSDLRSIDAPEDLNYSTLPGILNISGDPWAAMDQDAADLSAALKQPK